MALSCRGEDEQRSGGSEGPYQRVRTSRGQPALLAALTMPHGAITAGLGAHRVQIRAELARSGSRVVSKRVNQQTTMSVDGEGRFSASRKIDLQHGVETIWDGRLLYIRQRYGKFIQRKPSGPDEPKALAEGTYSVLPAYLGLMEPWLEVASRGQAMRRGRPVEHVTLRSKAEGGSARASGLAVGWRRSIVVESALGEAWLDQQSGAPLEVKLKARWSFALPDGPPDPKTGIPKGLDRSARGAMELSLTQVIDQVGEVVQISTPSARLVVQDARRYRPEIERQMIVGELPVRDDWRDLSPP